MFYWCPVSSSIKPAICQFRTQVECAHFGFRFSFELFGVVSSLSFWLVIYVKKNWCQHCLVRIFLDTPPIVFALERYEKVSVLKHGFILTR